MRAMYVRRDARQPSPGCHPHDLRDRWCGSLVLSSEQEELTAPTSSERCAAPRRRQGRALWVAPRALTRARCWRASSGRTSLPHRSRLQQEEPRKAIDSVRSVRDADPAWSGSSPRTRVVTGIAQTGDIVRPSPTRRRRGGDLYRIRHVECGRGNCGYRAPAFDFDGPGYPNVKWRGQTYDQVN